METIIAATQNKHKIKEIDAITRRFGMKVISRDEAGIPPFEVEETGNTFEENSYIKALEIMRYSGKTTIADDSGLEVDCLNGAPGIYSARFAEVSGEGADAANNRKLISLVEDVPWEERTARFVSVITMVYPDGRTLSARGEVEGHVILQETGTNGFGYDSLFVPLGYDITFGEFSPEDKNKISHRRNALQKLHELLRQGEEG